MLDLRSFDRRYYLHRVEVEAVLSFAESIIRVKQHETLAQFHRRKYIISSPPAFQSKQN